MTQRNRQLDAVVDTPLSEQDGVSREDQTRVNSLVKLSSTRVNSLLGQIHEQDAVRYENENPHFNYPDDCPAGFFSRLRRSHSESAG